MHHIHTEPGEHDHTVTAYVVRTDGEQPRALLHMHKKLGKLLTIGGHIETMETPWQAVAHELTEESGYDINELELLQPHERIRSVSGAVLHPLPVVANTHRYGSEEHFHSDTGYAFVAGGPPRAEVQTGESTDLRWLTEAELAAIEEPQIVQHTKEAYRHIFEVCLKSWDRVPPADFQL